MPSPATIAARIRRDGPLTVAAFMELALYDPVHGYYASAAQRSGRTGDFYTSVDVGPLFGELLSTFVRRAWRSLAGRQAAGAPFTLCEAGAGNGRLARDILDTLEREAPDCCSALSVALVERSPSACEAHASTLGRHAARLTWSADRLPEAFEGVLVANELLDAMPVHRLAHTPDGWREVYVDVTAEGDALVLREGPLSTPRLPRYFDPIGFAPPVGSVTDVSLAAVDWVREAASALRRGWIVLVDYGHEARRLYGGRHADGTLRAYRRHVVDGPPAGDERRPPWLDSPGAQDLTAHVDFTALGCAAREAGLSVTGPIDQTQFLVDLGLGDRLAGATGTSLGDVKRRLAAQALASPEGLGGSHRVLILGKDVTGTGHSL